MIHDVQKGPSCFLNSFLRLDPDIVPDAVSSLCLKDYMCTINPFYTLLNFEILASIMENLLWQGIFQPQGVTLRGVPTQVGVLVCSPLLCERAQGALEPNRAAHYL